MAFVKKDRIRETSSTTGTGTYTLDGAAVTGYQAFSAIGNANTCPYFATDGVNWETGIGTYTSAGTTLARTSVLESSNGGAAVNWGAGTRDIICGLPASLAPMLNADNTFTGANSFQGNVTLGDAAADTLTINAETISKPNIPCFLAVNSADDANVVGNTSTPVTVDFNSEVFDQSADFASDTFTAPATGRYLFAAQVSVYDLTTAMGEFTLRIVTSNRTYSQQRDIHVETAGDIQVLSMTVIADMDAADTAHASLTVTGGAGDTADIVGGANETFFCGLRVA